MIFLETERLIFRTHEEKDRPDFLRMHTDSEVRRYMGGKGWPLEKAKYRFQNQYLGRPEKTYGLWATILKEDNRYIGCCGLRAGKDRTEAFLGYILAKSYWGRGFATEAARAFIRVAFDRLRLLRLWADVEQGNVVSEHILCKFGFKYSGQKTPPSGRVILFYELTRAR